LNVYDVENLNTPTTAANVEVTTFAPTIDVVTTNGDTLVRSLRYGAVSGPITIAAGRHTVNLFRRNNKQKLGTHTFDVSNQANGYVTLKINQR